MMKNQKITTRCLIPLLSILLFFLLFEAAGASEWKIVDDNSWCNKDSGFFQETVCETREIDVMDKWKDISVDAAPNGNIRIEAWDRDTIRIEVRIKANAKTEKEAEELISQVELKAENGIIDADGPMDLNSKKSWSAGFYIMVPEKVDLKLNAMNGGISITDIEGTIKARTVNGGISLNGLAGEVDANTVNGGITAKLKGQEWQGKGLNVSAVNGGIKISIPEDYSAELEAGTVNGGIHVDFPVTVKGWIKKKIKTTLGEGGAPIKAKTVNGGVRVNKN